MPRITPLLLLGLAACLPSARGSQSAVHYVEQVHSLLYENSLLSDTVLKGAGAVHDGTLASAELRKRWTTQIAPLAVHLHDQATLLQPPADWSTRHEQLVGIWEQRAEAYLDIGRALDAGDSDLWLASRKNASDAMLNEEAWFVGVNGELAPLGLSLDQFP